MSSNDAPLSSSSDGPSTKKYIATYLMAVNNVGQLVADKAELFSPIFTCTEDAHRTSFKIMLGFGKAVENQLEARLISTNRAVKIIWFQFVVYDKEMGLLKTQPHRYDDNPLTIRVGSKWGWKNIYSLESLGNVERRIMVEVEYSAEVGSTLNQSKFSTDQNQNAVPSNLMTLSRDFSTLLEKSLDADVTIFAGDGEVKCHKVVLIARSTYFRSLFQSGMKESQSNTITINDVSPDLLRQVLKFLYSGQLPADMEKLAFGLLPVTEKYALDELKTACEDAIRRIISIDNVIQALILAHFHRCPDLFRYCIPLFKKNVEELKKGEDWKDVEKSPELLERLLISCCKEDAAADLSGSSDSAECARLGYLMQLSSDFAKLFADGTMDEQVNDCADVTLRFEGGEILRVHKPILRARRPQISKVAGGSILECKTKHRFALVNEVYKFLYSGASPENLETIALELLPVAFDFCVNELKTLCDHAIRRILSLDNVVDILSLAEANRCPDLFSYCLPFFKANASRLKPDCAAKLKAQPDLLLKLVQMCSE